MHGAVMWEVFYHLYCCSHSMFTVEPNPEVKIISPEFSEYYTFPFNMLVKLRINNEQEWFDMYDPSNINSISCDKQFIVLLKDLIESLDENKIPKGLISFYNVKSEGNCVFIFNGYDHKSNTYFYNYTGIVS